MNEKEECQNKLKPIFNNDKSIFFAYLFGSTVQGKTNFESDIDLAVFLDEKERCDLFKKRLSLIEEIQAVLKKPVEVVILNEIKSIFFKFVIIKEGKLIFERDRNQRIDFELKTMQDYYDFRPFIEAYNRAYLERSLQRSI